MDNYPLLKINNLSIFHSYKKKIKIVSDLNLKIRSSEVFGLVGESGCGKSMTALSILKLLPKGIFAEGNIFFSLNHKEHFDILKLDDKKLIQLRGKHISMVFQDPLSSLNPVFTIGEQIRETLIIHEGISKKEAQQRSIELLRSVKIPEPEKVIKSYPHQLSGGMRQRVMIAIAISCNPLLLIADEPTTSVDVTIQAELLKLLMEIKEKTGMSILLITHDLSIISEVANIVAIMYAGRIVEIAPVEEIFKKPMHPYTIGLYNSLPNKRGVKLSPIPGTVPLPEELPSGCKFSNRCKYKIPECEKKEPLLLPVNTKEHFVRCIKVI